MFDFIREILGAVQKEIPFLIAWKKTLRQVLPLKKTAPGNIRKTLPPWKKNTASFPPKPDSPST